jgi:sigma-E factor negative regulatory protein RseA
MSNNSNSESNSKDSGQPISLAEHLSTVLDDEAGSFEQRRVLDELTSGENSTKALTEKLSHFALIGESMRSTKPAVVAGPSFLAGIHGKIAEEDEYNDVQIQDSSSASIATNDSTQKQSWLKPVGGFALAASFAAVAFMGVQNSQLENQLAENSATIAAITEASQNEKTALAEAQATIQLAKATLVENDATPDKQEYRQANAHARSFLKRYVDSHVQYASTSTFVPSVRVIAYADY